MKSGNPGARLSPQRRVPLRASGQGRAPTVAVLGGGMGGMACAHELAREGAAVTIYEASSSLGGKARSQFIPGTGTQGRFDLPGEHGFRFYPAFYRHVTASMQEIYDPESPTGTVVGNLTSASDGGMVLPGVGIVKTPRKLRTLADCRGALASIRHAGGSVGDLAHYLGAHLKYLTACDERRDGEIELLPWAEFVGAHVEGRYAEAFREVLLAGTRVMVAMDATRGSSRTVGLASSLLMVDSLDRSDIDRTMMGPTTLCWLEPWHRQLTAWGVQTRFGQRVARLELDGRRVARAWVTGNDGRAVPIEADAYVLAVPLDVAHGLMTDELSGADPALELLRGSKPDRMTDWMIGAQFFLDADLPLCEGHLFFPRSPWALTAISQAQFWNRGARGMHRYGDGRLKGILSVDVSGCFTRDTRGRRLVDLTSRDEILSAILDQIATSLTPRTGAALRRATFAAHLDYEVRVGPDGASNAARLLVHPPGSWQVRPDAVLTIPNLFLAADFVRTSIDLATMEGANEAGRRAARGVLESLGFDASHVKLYHYPALDLFHRLRAVDSWLHASDLPQLIDMPGRLRTAMTAAIGRLRA